MALFQRSKSWLVDRLGRTARQDFSLLVEHRYAGCDRRPQARCRRQDDALKAGRSLVSDCSAACVMAPCTRHSVKRARDCDLQLLIGSNRTQSGRTSPLAIFTFSPFNFLTTKPSKRSL